MYNLNVLDNQKLFYYTDVITRPDKLIEFIENMNDNPKSYQSISAWKDWFSSSDLSDNYGKTKNIFNYYKTEDEELNREILYIVNCFKSAALYCANNYAINLGIQNINLTGTFHLQKYNPGAKMGPHVDGYNQENKFAYSVVLYLNDNYDGGEINFPNQNVKLKPQAGSMLIFPSNEPYVHEVNEVVSGNKYIATTMWLK
jgi:Rps23 Pro-64 3,4-dihydroxylase Tpa1-like proline 4-hydroxylase